MYIVVIPGGVLDPIGGSNEKNFLGSLSLAITPLHKSVNFYPGCRRFSLVKKNGTEANLQ